jgi:surface polysaccharide O-acyltransferase-like enzyme
MSKETQQRTVYLDILRVFACFFVVMVHVSAAWLEEPQIPSFHFTVSYTFNTIAIAAPAVFLALSGAVFLNPDLVTDVSPKKMWKKYILRLVVAYVVWSILYTVVKWAPYYTFSMEAVRVYVKEFFFTPIYHLWFLPALMVIYAFLPILRPGLSDPARCRYFLILYIPFQILMPLILSFDIPGKEVISAVSGRFPYMLLGYIGYFVLGRFLDTVSIRKTGRAALYTVSVLCTALSIWYSCRESVRAGYLVGFSNTLYSLSSFLLVCAAFILFRQITCEKEGLRKAISFLAKLTFGIYLLHPMVLDFASRLLPGMMELPAIVEIPLITLCLFLLCIPIVWVLRKIPFVNRYLV